MAFENVVDMICTAEGERGVTFISKNGSERYVSYHRLLHNARQALHLLRCRGINAGEELIMQIEENEPFLTVFWACMIGGIIPVPITVGHNDEHKLKIFKIWGILSQPYIIGADKTFAELEKFADKSNLSGVYEEVQRRSISMETVFKLVCEWETC